MGELDRSIRLLFVDDEINVLSGIRRLLRSRWKEWKMQFVCSAAEALIELSRYDYDVIVTDARMPGMDGISLLIEVSKRYPGVTRIILSGQADQELIAHSVLPAHQYIAKPCDSEVLIRTLEGVLQLRQSLGDSKLLLLVSQMQKIPSLPNLYRELVEKLESADSTIADVAAIVRQDQAMTLRILQLVNSAFFGPVRTITDPAEAVSYLGLNTISSLVLTVKIFEEFDARVFPEFPMEQIWQHSLNVSLRARDIARLLSLSPSEINDCQTAGMLHDIGKLILAHNFNDRYAQVLKEKGQAEAKSDWQLEDTVFETNHADVGAYLAGTWGLPTSIVDAIAYHHCPQKHPHSELLPLTVVHAANAISDSLDTADPNWEQKLDKDYLSKRGLLQVLLDWQSKTQAKE